MALIVPRHEAGRAAPAEDCWYFMAPTATVCRCMGGTARMPGPHLPLCCGTWGGT